MYTHNAPTRYHMCMVLCVMLVAAMVACSSAAHATERALFTGEARAIALTPPASSHQIKPVGVDVEAVSAALPGDVLIVPLDGRVHRLIVNEAQSNGEHSTVHGSFEGHAQHQFLLTRYGRAVAGWFLTPDDHQVHILRPGGEGSHYLSKDRDNDPPCAGGVPTSRLQHVAVEATERNLSDETKLMRAMPRNAEADALRQAGGDGGGLAGGSCQPLPLMYFDILVVYTTLARNAAGGFDEIRAQCVQAVSLMSLALVNSGTIPVQSRVAGFLEVSYNEATPADPGSEDSYDYHLDRLADPDDGFMDNVHTVRNSLDADIVTLLVADTNAAGLGYCTSTSSNPFSVSRWDRAVTTYTLAHEVGHNIGCAHDPDNDEGDCTPFSYGFGHNWMHEPGFWFHTVMSYPPVKGSMRILHFSNPDINFEGNPTGTLARRNADVILNRSPSIEDFRLTRMDVWADFNAGGIASGSFTLPYGNISSAVSRVQNNGEILPTRPTLRIKSSSTSASISITKCMTIEACGGMVTIGQ